MYTCEKCDKSFEKRHAYIGHCSSHNRKKKEKVVKIHSCKYCEKIFKSGPALGGHVNLCKLNPDYKKIKSKRIESITGVSLSETHKKAVSNGMKKAHKEGRAWNIGMSRWNNEPSYPETFFMKVIENEFSDKDYKREYNVGIYSLDFAWLDKKKVIEIDGDQHQRFKEYKERDQRKDKFLVEKGWEILRIKWKDMYNEPKRYIKIAKEFIDN